VTRGRAVLICLFLLVSIFFVFFVFVFVLGFFCCIVLLVVVSAILNFFFSSFSFVRVRMINSLNRCTFVLWSSGRVLLSLVVNGSENAAIIGPLILDWTLIHGNVPQKHCIHVINSDEVHTRNALNPSWCFSRTSKRLLETKRQGEELFRYHQHIYMSEHMLEPPRNWFMPPTSFKRAGPTWDTIGELGCGDGGTWIVIIDTNTHDKAPENKNGNGVDAMCVTGESLTEGNDQKLDPTYLSAKRSRIAGG
jgi:hypothetical protein